MTTCTARVRRSVVHGCADSVRRSPAKRLPASAAPGQTATGVIAVAEGVDEALSTSGRRRERRPSRTGARASGAWHRYASIIALEKLPATVDAL